MYNNNNIQIQEKSSAFWGLRFIACFFVFSLHCYTTKLSHFAAWSVSLFFMMSGFLYGKKYANCELAISSTFSFWIKKLKKIYPLVCFTAFLAIPFFVITIGKEEIVRQIIPYFLLLQGFSYKYSAVLIAPTWFISVILFLYLLTPLLIKLAKVLLFKIGKIGTVCVCVFGILFLIIYSQYMVRMGADAFWIYSFAPIRIVEYYIAICIGMFAGRADVRERLAEKRKAVFYDIVIMMVFLLIVVCGFSFWISPAYWRDALWIIPNGVLLYFADKNIGQICKMLCWKPIASLGKMSFEIYLFHPVFLLYSTFYNELWDSNRVWRLCCFCVIFILTVISSYLWKRIFVRRTMRNAR